VRHADQSRTRTVRILLSRIREVSPEGEPGQAAVRLGTCTPRALCHVGARPHDRTAAHPHLPAAARARRRGPPGPRVHAGREGLFQGGDGGNRTRVRRLIAGSSPGAVR